MPENLKDTLGFDEGALRAFEKQIGYAFKDVNLLKLALVHPSADIGISNQRLEFLGDAILSAIVSERLYIEYPNESEGVLTALRAAYTRGAHTANMALKMGFANVIKFRDIADAERLLQLRSTLEDAFEALVGAIFLDSNYQTAKKTVLAWYGGQSISLFEAQISQNPKGALQELCAKQGNSNPVYEIVKETGASNSREFVCKVSALGKSQTGSPKKSKKEAQISAAEKLLRILNA